MITNGEILWSFVKFSQLILKEIYEAKSGEFVCGYVILGLTELIGVFTHSLVSIEVGNPVKVSLGPMQERIKRLVWYQKYFQITVLILHFKFNLWCFPLFPGKSTVLGFTVLSVHVFPRSSRYATRYTLSSAPIVQEYFSFELPDWLSQLFRGLPRLTSLFSRVRRVMPPTTHFHARQMVRCFSFQLADWLTWPRMDY